MKLQANSNVVFPQTLPSSSSLLGSDYKTRRVAHLYCVVHSSQRLSCWEQRRTSAARNSVPAIHNYRHVCNNRTSAQIEQIAYMVQNASNRFSGQNVTKTFDRRTPNNLQFHAGERVVWCGVMWRGVVWYGVKWFGVVWCGVVWCGAMLCSVV